MTPDELDELRAERDHWRSMFEAMRAAARAGIEARKEQP